MKKELTILIVGTVVWCAGILLAPLFSPSVMSDGLYAIYSTVCHQFKSRSFYFHGEPLAVCIRCSAIYGGFLIALLILRFNAVVRRQHYSPTRILAVSVVPIAIDGLLSFTHFYESTTVSRLITGGMFGGGLAFLLHTSLAELIHSILNKVHIRYE